MSKLLKAIATKHRPHIAAKMIRENGYDEARHLLSRDLHTSGVISKDDMKSLDECLDDLDSMGHTGAKAVKLAADGKLDPSKLNDRDFLRSIMALDDNGGEGDADDGDSDDGKEGDDFDLPIDTDSKVTA